MGRPKKNKDPYEGLSDDFRSAVLQGDEGENRNRLAEIALAQQELIEAMEKDLDLQQAKEAAKVAGEVYSSGKKMHRLQIAFIKATLESQGKL